MDHTYRHDGEIVVGFFGQTAKTTTVHERCSGEKEAPENVLSPDSVASTVLWHWLLLRFRAPVPAMRPPVDSAQNGEATATLPETRFYI